MRTSSLSSRVFFVALVICLLFSVFFATMGKSRSSSADATIAMQSAKPKNDERMGQMKIVKVEMNSPKITLADPQKGEDVDYLLQSGATVTLNGEPVQPLDLMPADEIRIKKDSHGAIAQIEAHRHSTGILVSCDNNRIVITPDYLSRLTFKLSGTSAFVQNGQTIDRSRIKTGDHVSVSVNQAGTALSVELCSSSILGDLWNNFQKNLFKPLLLFFYLGFAITLLRVPFEFPQQIYQALTMYLLVAIGWHGGEELACLHGNALAQAAIFMVIGFTTNLAIGFIAYYVLRAAVPKLRRIDAAAIAGHYGSDSAGTFVTALGVLQVAAISFAAYMPVMLAVMEIPGCLVALFLSARLRAKGMDSLGNMEPAPETAEHQRSYGPMFFLSPEVVREIFLNPGLFLLIGGITIGYISRLQGPSVTAPHDRLFIALFQGILCLFLLEMGMTAAKRVRDLRTAGSRFVLFGLIAPNIFAIFGILVASLFSHISNQPLQLGTYVLFAVLCGSSSYIAVPAIQRLAIPEASPTLALAASLGLTFTYNVTVGIPLYLAISEAVVRTFPVF